MGRLAGTSEDAPLDEHTVDALYGLEPVFEPGASDASNPAEFVDVDCPYCGERFVTAIDLSAGGFAYVEDCQVCCQPIELASELDETGALVAVRASRSD
jgi:Cysteine-rich CPXCG